MADTVVSSQRKDPSIRKNNKPLMEKKRRARINNCLGQLKTLTLQALKKDSSQFSKLEKADILELTVKHLRNLQRQQLSASMATESSVMSKYRSGFNECANEVMRYLSSAPDVTTDVRSQLINHLANCLQTVNNVQNSEATHQRCLQPISVQIPSSAQNTHHQNPSVPSSTHHQSAPHPQIIPSPTSTPSSSPVQQLSGAFHILPGNMCSGGAVAVYLGTQSNQQVPVYSMQVPSSDGGISAFVPSPSDSLSPRSSPSGFSSSAPSSPQSSPQSSPVHYGRLSESRYMPYSTCSPSQIKFKEEQVWRPW